MYKITDKLATHGFMGSAKISNLYMKEEELETGYIMEKDGTKWTIVDVRQLKDGDPNPLLDYATHINRVNRVLDLGRKAVVCCEAGQSRSNAIALGVLMTHSCKNMLYDDALKLIEEKVPIAMIDPYHLKAIRRIFGVHELH